MTYHCCSFIYYLYGYGYHGTSKVRMYIDYLRIINTFVPRSFEGTKVSVRLIVNVIHTDRE